MKVLGVIPARYASTRFPGKPLAMINGKPMIQHVYENSRKSKKLNRLIVATDDEKIYNIVMSFWGEVVMTSTKHKSGTDRIGEIVKRRNSEIGNPEIIVNIQGDEPFINPNSIDRAIEPLIKDNKINVSTLCCKITDIKEINNPNVVKVVFDKNKFAVKFSRKIIPNISKRKTNYFKHIGLYVYRKNYLMKLVKMKQSKLEKAEKLEQLRILESGERIKIVEVKKNSVSIDSPEDLKKLIGHK